jgi:hypothetical protein
MVYVGKYFLPLKENCALVQVVDALLCSAGDGEEAAGFSGMEWVTWLEV